jgi:hypothetical protein
MNPNTLSMLNSEFQFYWAEWRKERLNNAEDLEARVANEYVTLSIKDDPLFSSGLLTTQGILLYRTYVPIGHETNQPTGEADERCTEISTDP